MTMVRSRFRLGSTSVLVRCSVLMVIIMEKLVTETSLAMPQLVPFDDDLEGEPSLESRWIGGLPVFDLPRVRYTPSEQKTTVSTLQSESHLTTIAPSKSQVVTSDSVDHQTSDAVSCDAIFCPAGRVCRVVDDRPKCLCRDQCPVRRHEVCGTDGVVYPSHCELHRTACTQHRHIGVDPTGGKCTKDLKQEAEVVVSTVLDVGNSVELKCTADKGDVLSWKRNDALLNHTATNEIKIYDDGSLYIENLALHLMGNYTCYDRTTGKVIQRHWLIVQDPPRTFVHPQEHICHRGASITVKCYAVGVPQPTITWQHDGQKVDGHAPFNEGLTRYILLHNNTVLEMQSLQQSGSYECSAANDAGSDQRSITVIVGNDPRNPISFEEKSSELFMVFHDRGYTVYEVGQCHIKRQVSSSIQLSSSFPEFGSSELGSLCPLNQSCSWGDAVVVGNAFVYVAQPNEKRVLVIDLNDRFNPIEVIVLDGHPISVDFVDHLDQVWVVCLKEMTKDASKVAVVLRDAGKIQRHHPAHVRSGDGAVDEISNLFLPTETLLKDSLLYGYAAHNDQMALEKLDLVSLKYVSRVDLTKWKCLPMSATIIQIGGFVMVGCRHPNSGVVSDFLLVLDYVTDAVLNRFDLGGRIYVSPDSRRIVVIAGSGRIVSAFSLSDDGKLEHTFDEYLEMDIGHLAFIPSDSGFGYSAFAVSFSQPTILLLDLSSGKVSLIEGVTPAHRPVEWRAPIRRNHLISSVSVFAEHFMIASSASVTTYDIGIRRAQCTWQDVRGAELLIPVPLTS